MKDILNQWQTSNLIKLSCTMHIAQILTLAIPKFICNLIYAFEELFALHYKKS
jgi:hypothetical protein